MSPRTGLGPFLRHTLAAAALLATAACDASFPAAPSDPVPVVALRLQYLSGASDVVLPSTTAPRFIAYAVDADGAYREVTTQTTWSSSNTAILRPQAGSPGGFQAAGPGAAEAVGTFEGFTDAVTVIVRPVRPSPPSLTLLVDTSSLAVGRPARVRVFMQLAGGGSQDVSSMATLTSSNTNIATTSAAMVTGVAPGTVDLSATFNGLTARYGISVRPRSF